MKFLNSGYLYVKFILFISLFSVIGFAGAASAERVSVSVPKANIRSGPGTGYAVLWEVEKYHPLMVLKKEGEWYRFRDFEGDEGWIFHSVVSNTDAVITQKDKCNVRSGPTTKSNVVFTAEKGIPFKVLDRKDPWLYIEHDDGDKGWIHGSLVW